MIVEDCEHRWTPGENGISICELCERTAFSKDDEPPLLKDLMRMKNDLEDLQWRMNAVCNLLSKKFPGE